MKFAAASPRLYPIFSVTEIFAMRSSAPYGVRLRTHCSIAVPAMERCVRSLTPFESFHLEYDPLQIFFP